MFWKLLLAAACIWSIYYRWQKRRIYRLCKQIRPINVASYPIIGQAHVFKGNTEEHIKALNLMGENAIESGGLVSLWMANKLYIVIGDPLAAEVVLKTCLDKDDTTMKFIRFILGNGNIFAPVHIWRPRRKILAPVFSLKNLTSFVPEFVKQAEIMTKLLEQKVDKGDFSIWNYVNTYTFDAICKNSLGVDFESQQNNSHPYLQAFEVGSRVLGIRLISPWLYWDFVFEHLESYSYQKLLEAKTTLHSFADEVIRKKRKEIADINAGIMTKTTNKTFLDMLIESSGGDKGYSDIELREEILVIISAGSDTSAVATSFTSVMLSRFPEIQDKVCEELQEVFGDSDRPITAADLPKLVYMEAVIKETLRMYPAVPVYVREVFEDVKLPSGETLVKGVGILVNLYGLHRNPKYWGEDVHVFRPERFLEGPLKHPAQFIPFSYSLRNCLGGTYAMMSMKIALATMLRKYRFLPPANLDPKKFKEPLRIQFNIMLRHVDNYTVRLERRR